MPDPREVTIAAERGPITVICEEPPEQYTVNGRVLLRFKHPLGTVFPQFRTIVNLSVPHPLQKDIFFELENGKRIRQGLPPLGSGEVVQLLYTAADIIIDAGIVYVRPLPTHVGNSFPGDDLLCEVVPRKSIRFLDISVDPVRRELKRRGELWRLAVPPIDVREIKQFIISSLASLATKARYYYSRSTGKRMMTLAKFLELGGLPFEALKSALKEVQREANRRNLYSRPELEFFGAEGFDAESLLRTDLDRLDEQSLRGLHARWANDIRKLIAAPLQQDDIENEVWRKAMFALLCGEGTHQALREDETVTEEQLIGLSQEFVQTVQWLPGARMEHRTFRFDPLFKEAMEKPDDTEMSGLCDERVKSFIPNIVRQHDCQVTAVNVGRVIHPLGRADHRDSGRRGVYVYQVQLDKEEALVRVIRVLKWDVGKRIEEARQQGRQLSRHEALLQTTEYLSYVLDRHIACQRLSLNAPSIRAGIYTERWENDVVLGFYCERMFVPGRATNRIPAEWYRSPPFVLTLARALGRALAPNLIVSRISPSDRQVLFDDGDEIWPAEAPGAGALDLVVADTTGSFLGHDMPLLDLVPGNIVPVVNRRRELLNPADLMTFTAVVIASAVERYDSIRTDIVGNRPAYREFFVHRGKPDAAGNLPYRWLKILDKVEQTPATAVRDVLVRAAAKALGVTEGELDASLCRAAKAGAG
ncbi:MAG: hypothetical protein NTW87_09285 [Planctomycetota bacterium]|nr:hypothetical protein [Planctomycetota bacterium]